MQGVEILNKTEILKDVGSCWWVGLIFFGIGLIITIVIFLISKDVKDFFVWLSIVGIFSVLFGAIFSNCPSGQVATGKYTYQVTISDEVKMNEFLDKYEIIKQDGKIYTVKERN